MKNYAEQMVEQAFRMLDVEIDCDEQFETQVWNIVCSRDFVLTGDRGADASALARLIKERLIK